MSSTSGFVPPDPTSGLPYPFYNFDAMHAAAADLSGSVGGGSVPPEVDFRAMTSSNGYSMATDVVGGLQRYADCRTRAMTTGPSFLPPSRTPYVNGGTALPVSLNSAVGQQVSPPSAITPTSPTDIVYPWMTIVGKSTVLSTISVFYTFFVINLRITVIRGNWGSLLSLLKLTLTSLPNLYVYAYTLQQNFIVACEFSYFYAIDTILFPQGEHGRQLAWRLSSVRCELVVGWWSGDK